MVLGNLWRGSKLLLNHDLPSLCNAIGASQLFIFIFFRSHLINGLHVFFFLFLSFCLLARFNLTKLNGEQTITRT